MNQGLDNFSGDRLAQAMEFRMVSNGLLAERLNVAPSTITKYLNGDNKPVAENFVRLYQSLGFPPSFFTTPPVVPHANEGEKLWRSLASAKRLARLRGEVALDWQYELWTHFNSIFDLPKFDLGDFQIKSGDYTSISYQKIEDIAMQIRQHWGAGQQPLKNLVRSMERSGIVVNAVNLMAEKLDAVSTIREGTPYVLLNSFEHSAARTRFDAAHELGHILLHSGVGGQALKKDGFAILEDQAHYFASALLLPAESFLRDLWAPTMKCFEELKAKWIVSIQAMMRRALELNAITESQYSYLNIAISRKNWRRVEPLDDSIKVESPKLFAKCLEKLEKEKGVNRLETLEALRLPSDVAEQIFAVERGFFECGADERQSNVLEFLPRAATDN
ncbi:XRE family transcriptional regulator [Haloferula sp. BvORR071]|uniref:XRE family transcriptional regulator n=1 Tax=Haloferula sp. BvORR071 TaxID=1396141 RepID=UPI0005521743|nr:XRE family transcriptional regulator [Haloferula sp. BvORR071]